MRVAHEKCELLRVAHEKCELSIKIKFIRKTNKIANSPLNETHTNLSTKILCGSKNIQAILRPVSYCYSDISEAFGISPGVDKGIIFLNFVSGRRAISKSGQTVGKK